MFLKRRPGLSVEEFPDHYENTHTKLAEKYITGSTIRYVRRFIEPVAEQELPFDVITELWADDKEVFEAICKMQVLAAPPPEILADEEWLFDRSMSRVSSVRLRIEVAYGLISPKGEKLDQPHAIRVNHLARINNQSLNNSSRLLKKALFGMHYHQRSLSFLLVSADSVIFKRPFKLLIWALRYLRRTHPVGSSCGSLIKL